MFLIDLHILCPSSLTLQNFAPLYTVVQLLLNPCYHNKTNNLRRLQRAPGHYGDRAVAVKKLGAWQGKYVAKVGHITVDQ